MRKTILGLFILCFMIFGLVATVPGQNRYNYKSGLTFTGIYSIPGSDEMGSGGFGGSLGYYLGLGKYFGIEVAAHGIMHSTSGSEDGLSKGTLIQVPLQFNLCGRLPLGAFVVYVAAGANYTLNQFSMDSSIKNVWSQVGYDVKDTVNPGIGFQGGGGFEYYISKSLSLILDARYFMHESSLKYKITDLITGSSQEGTVEGIELNQLALSLGIKWYLR